VKSEPAAPGHPFTVYRSRFTLYFPAVFDRSTTPNVLAVRFSSIGDVLLTTPLLRAIRQRHPGSRITVLTRNAYVPLLSHNPHVTQVLGISPERGVASLAADLRKGGYTHLLDLHDSVRSRILRTMVPGRWSTYPKHRLARSVLIHAKRDWYRDSRPVPERYFSAARDLEVTPDGKPPELFLSPEAEREVADWLSARMGPNRALVALAPGAAHATKRWPIEHWRTLIRQLLAREVGIVIVGGKEDSLLAGTLLDGSGSAVADATGLLSLQGTGALLRRTLALVSGDTGVMHMATAVGTPVVALFGPTVRPFGFFPYSSRAHVLELSLPCRPCSSKGGPRCPLGHHHCLFDIRPERVYQALEGIIS
jgi:lipopolysaccharide heptosyltransferase II